MAAPNTTVSVQERYNHLESQVTKVATSLDGFIKDSVENRSRMERDASNMWAAIREVADNLRNAIEKLSTRGQLSWSMIATAVATLLSVVSAGAYVGHMLMESRIKQTEIRSEYAEKIADIRDGNLEKRIERLENPSVRGRGE